MLSSQNAHPGVFLSVLPMGRTTHAVQIFLTDKGIINKNSEKNLGDYECFNEKYLP